jgi:hypothetical protein
MAAIPGSIPYTGFIAPTDSTDTFPVTKPEWGLGGLRRVADLTERDAITSPRRELGMLVYVVADQTYYTLKTGLTNSDWEEASFAYQHLTPHTYAELQTLVSTNDLVQGAHYLLTDYQTIYDQPDFQSNGSLKGTLVLKTETTEPLILTAASDSTFSNTVISTIYPKDRIQYDFTIDETYVSNSPCKGRITDRIDEWNNRTDYDHRTVKFIRYESSTGSGIYNVINDNGEDSQEVLTFGTGCFNNYIGDVWSLINIAGQEFTNFVIGDSSSSNKVGNLCLNNTWGTQNTDNTWGDSNVNNTWGNDNVNNTWGDINVNNTWGNGNANNTWGESNGNNTWGNGNVNNTWGTQNTDNTWGDSNVNNTWGNDNVNNTWDDNNQNNTLGDYNGSNTWGGGNASNTWGNGNGNNIWGTRNTNNTWGNGNTNNTWGDFNTNNNLTNDIANFDFTSATHVLQPYFCEIFLASNSNFYLKYFDGTQYQFVSPTS